MKTKFIISMLLFASLSFLDAQNVSTKLWTEKDRQYLVTELERSQKEVTEEVDQITDEQWHFKPSPEAWSIG
ncbi:MAG: hypothetical protein KA340_15395, partial [Saprospiraceae bacterium]|nr:hypothetical protein [Saprospiraceae bacterium]